MKETHNTYQFILVLKNVDDNTPNLEDSLYEAGCNDALINFRNGAVYLHFDRKDVSLEKAVLSAIKNVESSSVNAVVINVGPEDLVTESEIAKRLNVERQTVSLWIKGERRKEKPFPKPITKLSAKSPFWKWREVVEWFYDNPSIKEKEEIENARFLESVNVVLQERDPTLKKSREGLLKKFEKNYLTGYPH
ncbi:MAG: helix-turn-helix transcriptional regulator [Candidatus Berkiellales bacterium]